MEKTSFMKVVMGSILGYKGEAPACRGLEGRKEEGFERISSKNSK